MHAHRTAHGRRGFTLVELLVVFAIVALMAAVVPVAFDKVRDSAQYRNTLRTMLTELRSARYRALSQGIEVSFSIDLDKRTYGVDGQPAHEIPQSLQLRTVVASTEAATGRVASIRFLPNGGATGGSVEVVRPAGNGTRLRVDWLSGRVSQEPLAP